MRPNTVKRRLRADEPTFGSWLAIGNTFSAEVMAHAGFDWLVVDLEHGAFGLDVALGMIQAVSTTDVVPMVRVAWDQPVLIKQALDLGAYGLVVPMVNSAEAATAVVQAAKFPPVGARSIGALRPELYAGPDYVAKANDELLVVVQIEHKDAVDRVDEILAVPGVDACFIGPSDLAASLGEQPGLAVSSVRVNEAIEYVLASGRRLHVPVGIHVPSAEAAIERAREGFRFIAVGSDAGFLTTGGRAAASTLRDLRG